MSQIEKKFRLHEDWAVVIAGFIVIFLALGGVNAPVPQYNWSTSQDLSTKVLTPSNLKLLAWQFIFVLSISIVLVVITGKPMRSFLVILPVLYIVAILALILAANKSVKSFNLEAVIFSLVFGLIIGNLFKLPLWFRENLNGELFVKIGLVLLGTSVIFSDILKAGSLGLIQALIVVLSVWYFAYWVCKKLKVDDEIAMMISSAVSICGVSAAIATAGAIKGDPKKLSYVISMVLITAIPMMIFMPIIA
ncbi:MAG: putative sulfate exporter family transporter, partial [Chitinophagaceae bacterium]